MSHAVSPFLVLKSIEIISKSARNFTTLMWPLIKVGYISEGVSDLGLIWLYPPKNEQNHCPQELGILY